VRQEVGVRKICERRRDRGGGGEDGVAGKEFSIIMWGFHHSRRALETLGLCRGFVR